MFTAQDRESLRADLLAAAQEDGRITGGAITGSATSGAEDAWSDVDLAFGVGPEASVAAVLTDFTELMYRDHAAVHHVDVPIGAWVYRVFLLASTLQVDLAFAPATDFGARGPTFRLVFGKAAPLPTESPPVPTDLLAWAWIYAIHVRTAIARGRRWQAEFLVAQVRNYVLKLACIRHGLPAGEGRGLDRLPESVRRPLEAALVGSLDSADIRRAYRAAVDGLLAEARFVDGRMADRLELSLRELAP